MHCGHDEQTSASHLRRPSRDDSDSVSRSQLELSPSPHSVLHILIVVCVAVILTLFSTSLYVWMNSFIAGFM